MSVAAVKPVAARLFLMRVYMGVWCDRCDICDPGDCDPMTYVLKDSDGKGRVAVV